MPNESLADGQEQYIGDGVYASCDGYQFWLRTEREGRQERIALELPVLTKFMNLVTATIVGNKKPWTPFTNP